MRFLLDESADFPLADFLSKLGHDVIVISHDYPQALTDRVILAIDHEEKRILITNDHDFGELIFRHKLPHAGIILFRLGEESLETKSDWLSYVLVNHAKDMQHFLVITDRGIRIRQAEHR